MAQVLKKIGIIELYHHHEVVLHWVRLWWDGPVAVELFLSRVVAADLGPVPQHMGVHLRQDGERVLDFLNRRRLQFADCDLLLVNTLAGDFPDWVRWQPPAAVAWLVHNQHAFFAPVAHLFRGPCRRRPLYMLGRLFKNLLWQQELRMRRAWVSRYPQAFFPAHSPAAAPLFAGHCRPLPVAACEMMPAPPLPSGQEPVRIAVPGVVRSMGRDYHSLLEALALALPRLRRPVRVMLLGSGAQDDGPAILARACRLRHPLLEWQMFTGALPQQQYDEHLRQAHFLVLPLQAQTCYSVYRERLGFSKISGGLNDMIRWGKPLLLPDLYPLPPELEPMTVRYANSGELALRLAGWINLLGFSSIAGRAPQILAPYQAEHLRAHSLRELTIALNQIHEAG